MSDIPGEKSTAIAYLLWLTIIGHRFYLHKSPLLYTFTLGYMLFGWLIDLVKIPEYVREYNSKYAYQKAQAKVLTKMGV